MYKGCWMVVWTAQKDNCDVKVIESIVAVWSDDSIYKRRACWKRHLFLELVFPTFNKQSPLAFGKTYGMAEVVNPTVPT